MTDYESYLAKSKPWKGYTLDEIRYRIALNRICIDVEKERLMSVANSLTAGNITVSSGTGMLKRMLNALSMMDYVIVMIKLVKMLRSLIKGISINSTNELNNR